MSEFEGTKYSKRDMANALAIMLDIPNDVNDLMKMTEKTLAKLFRNNINNALAMNGQADLLKDQDKLERRISQLQDRIAGLQKALNKKDRELKRLKGK